MTPGCLFFPEIYIDETELCGITNQFDGAVKVKLVHDIGAVVFNGLGAYKKFFTNLFS